MTMSCLQDEVQMLASADVLGNQERALKMTL